MAATQRSLLFIGKNPCVRIIKQATVLNDLGYEVHFLGQALPHGRGVFRSKTVWESGDDLYHVIKRFDVDIIHIHNEPSYMVQIAKEASDAKIVFDVHDSNYFRTKEDVSWYEEDVAAGICDAMVFVSDACREIFPHKDKPSIILPSASPERWSVVGPWTHYGGLVSNGGHTIKDNPNPLNNWRCYTDFYTELVKYKKVFAYSADFATDTAERRHYAGLGIKVGAFSHRDLIGHLGGHDWSLVGNLGDAMVWKYAVPNKFFDALSAGVPIFNLNVPSIAGWIDEYGLGVNVSSVEEMLENWDDHIKYRINVMMNRKHLMMENFIHRLTDLYEQL